MMRTRSIGLLCLVVVYVWLGAISCTPAVVAPLPPAVHRIAVLPPHLRGSDVRLTSRPEREGLRPLQTSVADLLADQARAQLAAKGFEVLAPGVVQRATQGRVPTNPSMAGHLLAEAHLDALALYLDVRQWEPTTRGMTTDGVIVALDVLLVDPQTGTVLWQGHRPARPVPLYGVVVTGQAQVFVAETVMRELLAPVR
jgi:hypothetical protein